MEIKIDEVQVQQALDEQATKGIKSAFEGYGIRSAIEKVIADSVVPAIITSAIEQAASSIDREQLAQHLAQEIARSVTRGTQAIIRETMVNIILDLKKIPDYERDKRDAARIEILHSIFKEDARRME